MQNKLINKENLKKLTEHKTFLLGLLLIFILSIQVVYSNAKYKSEIDIGTFTLKEDVSLVVYNETELNNAINFVQKHTYANATITFGSDITLTTGNSVSISGTTNLTIDMAGKTLSGSSSNGLVNIADNSDNTGLKIINGSIVNNNTSDNTYGLYDNSNSSELTIDHVSISGSYGGILKSRSGTLNLNNSSSAYGSIYGINSTGSGTMNINSSTVYSTGTTQETSTTATSGNGSRKTTTTTTTTGVSYGISQTGASTLNLENSTVYSKVYALYTANTSSITNIKSGNVYTTSGITITTTTKPSRGNATTSSSSNYYLISTTGKLNISGGRFYSEATSNPTLFTGGTNISLSGGAYQVEPNSSYIIDNYEATQDSSDNYWYITKIGGEPETDEDGRIHVTNQAELLDALSLAHDVSIVIDNDITLTKQIAVDSGYTTKIDFDGNTLTCTDSSINPLFAVTNDSEVTFTGGTISSKKIAIQSYSGSSGVLNIIGMTLETVDDCVIRNGEKATTGRTDTGLGTINVVDSILYSYNWAGINNNSLGTVNVTNSTLTGGNYSVKNDAGGNFNVYSGTFSLSGAKNGTCVSNTSGILVITGGMFEDNSAASYIDKTKYTLVQDGNMYTVVELTSSAKSAAATFEALSDTENDIQLTSSVENVVDSNTIADDSISNIQDQSINDDSSQENLENDNSQVETTSDSQSISDVGENTSENTDTLENTSENIENSSNE